MNSGPGRRAGGVTVVSWVAIVLAALAGAALTVVAWDDLVPSDALSNLGGAVAAVAYATLGALIVRRAGSVIGWLMLGEGAGMAFLAFGSAYAVTGIATHPGTLPAAARVGTVTECSFVPVAFLLVFMFFLFPSGKLPSRRWRPVIPAGLLMAGLTLIAFFVTSRQVSLPAPGGVSLKIHNPLAVE